MSFAGDLSAFAQKTGIRADQVLRKVVIDLTRELTMATPVDTGLARNNYFFGVDRNGSVSTSPSKTGAESLTRSLEFTATLKAGGVCYITNNLPYIMPLEFGHSKQAPAGMARIAVAKFQAIVDKAARL